MAEDDKRASLLARLSGSSVFVAPAMIAAFGLTAAPAIMGDVFGAQSGISMTAEAGEAEAEGEAGEAEAEGEAEGEAEAEAEGEAYGEAEAEGEAEGEAEAEAEGEAEAD